MIDLTFQDVRFMLAVLSLSDDLRKNLECLASDEDKVISADLADELRDLCAERLDTHGFDESYNITEEGQKLELLIDKLYVG